MRRSGEAIVGTKGSWLERALGVDDARSARRLARRWRGGGLGLIILCLLVYIPGLWTIPPVDRDESRFAQASRQMLESGTLEGWVVPRVQDKPRLNKPPLIYWLQASSAAILGDRPGQWAWLDGGSENIWVYRVPSVLSAMAAVLLTWRLGVRMFDPRAAWLGAAFLAVCPMVVWDAHQARADQLLLATTTGTMLALWCVWGEATKRRSDGATKGSTSAQAVDGALRVGGSASTPNSPSAPPRLRGEARLGWAIAFWIALALGIMTKGPITPMIAALTCVALSVVSRDWRWLRELRPVLGVLIVAAVVTPWVYLVGQEVGWSKYLSIIYGETIGRSAGAKEGHWGPPGYHIVLLGVLFWPGSLLTAAAIGRAWKRGMRAVPSSPSSPAPPPPPAGEVSNEALRVRRRGVEVDPDAAHTPSVTLEDSRDTSPAGPPGGGGAKALRRSVAGGASLRRLASLRPSRPAELFLLAWMLPAWVVFELISTKLPHYTMPLYPAVALMSARAVFGAKAMFLPALNAARQKLLAVILAETDAKCVKCRYNLHGLTVPACPECSAPLSVSATGRLMGGYMADRSQRAGRLLWLFFGIAICIGVPGAIILDNITPSDDSAVIVWNSYMMACGAVAWFVAILGLFRATKRIGRDDLVRGTAIAMVPSIVTFAISFCFLLPRTDSLWISRRVVQTLRDLQWTPDIPVACFGYTEDSLIFLTRGRIQREGNGLSAFAWPQQFPRAFLVVDDKTHVELLLARVVEVTNGRPDPTIATTPSKWGEEKPVEGFNYSIGRRQEVYIGEFRR